MVRAKKISTQDTINIKSLPIQAHIGASKYVNNDWGTIAFIIPRNQLQLKFADPELRYNCIYFLFGFDQAAERVYVGQAKKRNNGESVLARLREHDTSTIEKYCDTWEWAVVCTGKEDTWSLDDLNALEHAFYNEIPINQSLNGNKPNSGGANYDAYTDKIRQIKNYITSIGFNLFADNEDTEKIQVTSEVNENTIVEDLQNGLARIPEIVTPHKIVKAMCDILPPEVWNDQTVFLDPACKGGEYLREIYDRLMDCEIMQSKYPDEFERSNHILGKQLYGIALSQVSLGRTTKKLRGYDHNIRVIPNYIRKLKGIGLGSRPDGTSKTMQDILNEEFNRDMKIDVVIGNPPYQEGNQSIYPKFIDAMIKINPQLIIMITKNNWMNGNTLRPTRDNMISFGIKSIVNFPLVTEVFKGVSVATSIFELHNGYKGDVQYKEVKNGLMIKDTCIKVGQGRPIITEAMQVSIIDKVTVRKNFKAYDLAKNARMFSIASNGFFMHADYTEPCIDYTVDKVQNDDVEVVFMDSAHDLYSLYTSRDELPKGKEFVDTYKVVCGSKAASNNTVLSNLSMLEPGQIVTNSFGIVGVTFNKEEITGIFKYAKTKFQRALIKFAVSGDRVTYGVGCTIYLPMQNFASNSDIDWNQPISDIDQQLYKKYGLTQEEIDYIEKTIKQMD